MKISEAWLREWVDPPIDTAALAEQLTMAGLEIGSIEAAAPPFSGVVLGRVLETRRHPDADKLSVCSVDVGGEAPLEIVCGAANVRGGLLVATATVGARLPGGLKIRRTRLRGVESHGMICSASELGLAEESEGIMELQGDGPPGTCLREYLQLDDHVLEIELTPNRGDCLGLAGVAREVAVLNRLDAQAPGIDAVAAAGDARFPVRVDDPAGCPVYGGRVVRNLRSDAVTPSWMQERLRRAGLRPIHPVVDVTNYVMLELGQPMHAFDLRNLTGGIVVRRGRRGEKLTLLDGREVDVDEDVLTITDDTGVVALAGIMGGEHSGVADDTTDIFFESACFDPLTILGRARRYGLHTDASHRFERGVAPGLQGRAIERATALLLAIAGGEPGPVVMTEAPGHLPVRQAVRLRRARLARLLGKTVDDDEVTDILRRLEMEVEQVEDGWLATPPPFRFDIAIEADLIEEVARVHGYVNIPAVDPKEALAVGPEPEGRVALERLGEALVQRGYREAITYSFVDPGLQRMLFPDVQGLALANPISSELSVMRVSLWPGLIEALRQNLSRQQTRVRLFESGLRFLPQADELEQKGSIAGLMVGAVGPEQWDAPARQADFYDAKGDVEALLALTAAPEAFVFEAGRHPALHPGQTARILRSGSPVGWVGALHPRLQQAFDIAESVMLFELDAGAFAAQVPVYSGVSRYPAVRRDLAVVVDEAVSAQQVLECARRAAPELLREIRLFDVYRGPGVDSGRKSIALGLILQDYSSTLRDEQAEAVVQAVADALGQHLDGKIRE